MSVFEVSERAPVSEADNMFVVSTLGQARSAVAIASSALADESVVVAILATPANWSTPNSIAAYLERFDVSCFLMLLPSMPTVATLTRAKRVEAKYVAVQRQINVGSLWLSNTNSHYGVMAAIFKSSGVRLCYFEEGLGSYKDLEDASFARPSRRESLKILRSGISAALRRHLGFSWVYRGPVAIKRFSTGSFRFAKSLYSELSNFYSLTPTNLHRFEQLGSPHLANYFSPWTEFDEIHVVFPELLDEHLIRSDNVESVQLLPPHSEVELARAALAREIDSIPSVFFVSQPYGDRGRNYYQTVAKALVDASYRRVFVKFHPRERPKERDSLIEAFERLRIEVVQFSGEDLFTAEALLATGNFDVCVGISSSSLLYSERYFPEIEVVSVGKFVVSEVRRRGFRGVGYDTLQNDVKLFVDMRQRLSRSAN